MEIWTRSYLESVQDTSLSHFKKGVKYFVPTNRGLIGFKTKKDAKQYVDGLNRKVILYFDSMSGLWALDYAIGYIQRRVIDKEYVSGGFNIFGERLTGHVKDIVSETLKYQHGDAIKKFETLGAAHSFIAECGMIQVLNAH